MIYINIYGNMSYYDIGVSGYGIIVNYCVIFVQGDVMRNKEYNIVMNSFGRYCKRRN